MDDPAEHRAHRARARLRDEFRRPAMLPASLVTQIVKTLDRVRCSEDAEQRDALLDAVQVLLAQGRYDMFWPFSPRLMVEVGAAGLPALWDAEGNLCVLAPTRYAASLMQIDGWLSHQTLPEERANLRAFVPRPRGEMRYEDVLADLESNPAHYELRSAMWALRPGDHLRLVVLLAQHEDGWQRLCKYTGEMTLQSLMRSGHQVAMPADVAGVLSRAGFPKSAKVHRLSGDSDGRRRLVLAAGQLAALEAPHHVPGSPDRLELDALAASAANR